MIHPTAVIHPKAQLDPTVCVGPYAVIDQDVTIGPHCLIGPHVHLDPAQRRVPRRRIAAPLDFQRHLLEGHRALPRAAREQLRRLELDTPDAHVVFESAWYGGAPTGADENARFRELAQHVRAATFARTHA